MNINKKRRLIIDIVWLATLFLALLIFLNSQFGLNNFFDDHLTLTIEDTYFVVPKYFMFFMVSTLTFFVVYSLKVIVERFKIAFSNTIFLISIISLILLLTYVTGFIMHLSADGGTVIYPSLSTENQIIKERTTKFKTHYFILLQVILICIFGYVIKKKTILKFKK